MNQTSLVVAALFGALGIYLTVSSRGFPEGVGTLPGPGFFPGVIGVVMTALAVALVAESSRDRSGTAFRVENVKALGATLALLFAYLLLWGVVPFPVRTFVLLFLFLRLLGERWLTSLAVSIVLTVAVLLAFQYGLRVDLQ